MASKKGGLGRGLDAIFMDNDMDEQDSTVTLKVSEIEPNRAQPRKDFSEEALAELADSIAQHGVLQPLLVRPLIDGGYQIVAGERRWRACRMAGVFEVPVIIRELSDSEVMEIALIENLQRENLSAVEEAEGYKMLIDTYNFTQEEVSRSVGKSRPAVANALRLLALPEEVLTMLRNGKISAGHARALLALPDKDEITKIANLVVAEGMSVRALEKLVKRLEKEQQPKIEKKTKRSNFFSEVELSLQEYLGRKVVVSGGRNNKAGVLKIEFYGEDDLSDIARRLEKDE